MTRKKAPPPIVADAPPRPSPRTGRGIDWGSVLTQLRDAGPGKSVLLAEMTDLENVRSVYMTVRTRRHPDLRFEGGHVRGNMRNTQRPDQDDPTTKRGDLWLTLVED